MGSLDDKAKNHWEDLKDKSEEMSDKMKAKFNQQKGRLDERAKQNRRDTEMKDRL